MQNAYYKESLAAAVKILAVTRQELFFSIFNIAMAGELYEWNRNVEIGEVHEFSCEIFEGCDDLNIQLLMKLMINVTNTIESICNLNSIKI